MQGQSGGQGMSSKGPGSFVSSGRGFGGPRSVMPVVKAKDFKKTIKRLWYYFGKERKLLALIFVLVISSAIIGLAAPYLIGKAIDSMSGSFVNFGLLQVIATTLIAAYIIDVVLSVAQGWLMAGISQRIVQNLRNTVFAKLQKLTVSFFDLRTHGEIMSRLSNDMENISSTISQATIQLLSSVITVTGALVMMLILSPLLTLASVITIPMVFLVTKSVAKRTRVLFKEQQVILGKLNGHIEETISGLQIIKAFNHEEKVIESFDELNSQLNKVGVRAQIWSGFIMPLMNVINNISFAVIAGVGGALAVENLITIGVIASFLSYSRQFARPLNEIANIFNVLQSAVAGAERVFEILDEEEEQSDIEAAVEMEKTKGHVVFEDVSFGYRTDVSVLRNVSFEAKEGSTIALVGPTGAGKTTIVNLLARFYDVTSGRILIDGRDIRDYTRDSLRSCFGIVLQDTYLFSGSIRENIRYGKLSASDTEVETAAVMANADVFIKRLPKGYDTILTESGSNLSQGQRQLLAIARAILADPTILILDEATSSVDTRTELHIQEAMLKLMKSRTSFIIAHRLSTIRDADIIMVIDQGEIVEKGNHEELLTSGGVYSKMYFSQLRRTET
jgi:ATP-binding cassette, subfamily B, multidrug efflux pump